jgi:hypothetical protein
LGFGLLIWPRRSRVGRVKHPGNAIPDGAADGPLAERWRMVEDLNNVLEEAAERLNMQYVAVKSAEDVIVPQFGYIRGLLHGFPISFYLTEHTVTGAVESRLHVRIAPRIFKFRRALAMIDQPTAFTEAEFNRCFIGVPAGELDEEIVHYFLHYAPLAQTLTIESTEMLVVAREAVFTDSHACRQFIEDTGLLASRITR